MPLKTCNKLISILLVGVLIFSSLGLNYNINAEEVPNDPEDVSEQVTNTTETVDSIVEEESAEDPTKDQGEIKEEIEEPETVIAQLIEDNKKVENEQLY